MKRVCLGATVRVLAVGVAVVVPGIAEALAVSLRQVFAAQLGRDFSFWRRRADLRRPGDAGFLRRQRRNQSLARVVV